MLENVVENLLLDPKSLLDIVLLFLFNILFDFDHLNSKCQILILMNNRRFYCKGLLLISVILAIGSQKGMLSTLLVQLVELWHLLAHVFKQYGVGVLQNVFIAFKTKRQVIRVRSLVRSVLVVGIVTNGLYWLLRCLW